jgi:chromosome segregation ATPase
LLGALFGRKVASAGTVGRASTAMRGAARSARERGDIARARERLAEMGRKLDDLEADFQEETARLQESLDTDSLELREKPIRPRKADIAIGRVALVWTPWTAGSGESRPAYR